MLRLGFWVRVPFRGGEIEISPCTLQFCAAFVILFSLPLSDPYTPAKNSLAANFSNNFLYALLSLDGALR
jgi:hypothetical protein